MNIPCWFPFRARTGALLVAAALASGACGRGEKLAVSRVGGAANTGATADSMAFRNSLTGPDAGWTGPVFQLSHDYPTSAPGPCTSCPWLRMRTDFASTDWTVWSPYLQSVLDYVVQGQTLELSDQQGWKTEVNGSTRWFHVPWMAFDAKSGREFIHGTTNERTATPADFVSVNREGRVTSRHPELLLGVNPLPGATGADTLFETWAVGVYNEYGGYAIGKAIPSNGAPVAVPTSGGNQAMPVRFPEGTVVAKLLFTTATVEQVPYLRLSPEWTVDRHLFDAQADSFLFARAPQKVRLVQVDVAVRDNRSPIGWVYGTYAYNARQIRGPAWWQRITPVGVQWGNDPESWPAVDSARSKPISQTSLNPGINIPQHYGCNKRLAGPVDNRLSGCTSCHGDAYVPAPVGDTTSTKVANPFYFRTMCARADAPNAAYFANIRFPGAYSFPGATGPSINLDTSLQLWVAYDSYASWRTAQPGGG